MFVNDSNIWIAAKESVSDMRKYKTGDMCKLADVLANNRSIVPYTLWF